MQNNTLYCKSTPNIKTTRIKSGLLFYKIPKHKGISLLQENTRTFFFLLNIIFQHNTLYCKSIPNKKATPNKIGVVVPFRQCFEVVYEKKDSFKQMNSKSKMTKRGCKQAKFQLRSRNFFGVKMQVLHLTENKNSIDAPKQRYFPIISCKKSLGGLST